MAYMHFTWGDTAVLTGCVDRRSGTELFSSHTIFSKKIHYTVAHGPKLALRGVTSHLVTDMCMYSHAIVGVSPHDYGRAMAGYICPTHTESVHISLALRRHDDP
eukprot:COSAG01_NODE_14318_length_1469_cov_2.920438_1_plen_103_part_10